MSVGRWEGIVGETTTLSVYCQAAGVTDIKLKVLNPDDSSGDDITLSEAGTAGSKTYYEADFVPTMEGLYKFEVASATVGKLNGKTQALEAKPVSKSDLAGAGYDSAEHSLTAINAKLNEIKNNQGSMDEGFV